MRIHKAYLFLATAVLMVASVAVQAESNMSRVVDGVAVYFGIVPAALVRGHSLAHTERQMHGGASAGESHVMIALFDDKSGKRITNADVNVRITASGGLDVSKRLEPMVIADSLTYGNYFSLTGGGPYRIAIRFKVPGAARESHTEFVWSRS